MTLTIRPARDDDRDLYLRLLPELGVDDPPPTDDRWRTELVPRTHVAEQDGVPVGFCHWVSMHDAGYVRQLVVDPRARRTGAGRALLRFVAQRLRADGKTTWELNVKPENRAAIALYESLGFRRQYASLALRLAWDQVPTLPASPPAGVKLVSPAEDGALERLFSLAAGQLQGMREAKRVLLGLTDEAGQLRALAAFNRDYPGAFPFRVKDPLLARALLEAMRPHARPEHTFVNLVVEDDEALAGLLRSHGAQVRMNIEHFAGPLPTT